MLFLGYFILLGDQEFFSLTYVLWIGKTTISQFLGCVFLFEILMCKGT